MNKTKVLGQIFTETSEIEKMLDLYKKNNSFIFSKVLEPSFGSGHFLEKILSIMIDEGRSLKLSDKKISEIINNNLYGYEIDLIYYKQCIRNLKSILNKKKFVEKLEFKNLKNESIFLLNNIKFDLIIGNPPYVRVQNFDEGIKKIKLNLKRTHGNTDLFLIFIDFLLNFLKKNGDFIFIVPNSLGKSKSASIIRNFIYNNGSINYYDYEDQQLFPSVSVYSCILHYKNNCNKNSYFISQKMPKKSWLLKNNGFFEPENIKIIKKDLNVKNGVATLSDRIFIHEEKPEVENVLRAFKGSKMDNIFYAIFPYKITNGKVARFQSEIEFKKTFPKMFTYLYKYKTHLMNRSIEKNTHWFEYGRSQAIKDVPSEKKIIDTLIKPGQKKLKIKSIPRNSIVFSGLYTINNKIIEINDYKLIKSLRFKAKDMRGGYKKISSSMLKYDKQN